MLERPHHGERPLALGDVRAEVLPLGLGVSHEVEQVVGQLEGDAGGEPHLEQAARRLLRSSAHERAHVERHGGGVPRGLARNHVEVVLGGDVPTCVAHPAEVERLALERVTLHAHQLGECPKPSVRGERLVAQDHLEDLGERQVAGVYRQPGALHAMQARLAAAQLALVRDVVMDERGALEELDGDRAGKRVLGPPAHGLGAEKREHGPHALASACGEAAERRVEIAHEVAGDGPVGEGLVRGVRERALNEGQALLQVGDEELFHSSSRPSRPR